MSLIVQRFLNSLLNQSYLAMKAVRSLEHFEKGKKESLSFRTKARFF